MTLWLARPCEEETSTLSHTNNEDVQPRATMRKNTTSPLPSRVLSPTILTPTPGTSAGKGSNLHEFVIQPLIRLRWLSGRDRLLYHLHKACHGSCCAAVCGSPPLFPPLPVSNPHPPRPPLWAQTPPATTQETSSSRPDLDCQSCV